jgi:hypothetical protein
MISRILYLKNNLQITSSTRERGEEKDIEMKSKAPREKKKVSPFKLKEKCEPIDSSKLIVVFNVVSGAGGRKY